MHAVISAIRLTLGFLVIVVVSVAILGFVLLLIPFRVARVKLCNVYGKVVGRSITALTGTRPHIEHRERLDGSMPAIYVMNHTSALDAFLGIWMCPIGGCGVFKKEIVRVPFFGQIAWLSGHLLIDRFHKDKAVEALRETARFVKANRLGIWIMPEGTRSRDGRLLPFKKGFVHLAIATGLPVVPVIIHGAHKNWEKGTFRFNPMDLRIEVLEPVDTSSWREETASVHAEQLHTLFAEHLPDDMRPIAQPAAA